MLLPAIFSDCAEINQRHFPNIIDTDRKCLEMPNIMYARKLWSGYVLFWLRCLLVFVPLSRATGWMKYFNPAVACGISRNCDQDQPNLRSLLEACGDSSTPKMTFVLIYSGFFLGFFFVGWAFSPLLFFKYNNQISVTLLLWPNGY